jgi:uncharacterized protein YdaU (DUF1376 family)
MTPPWMPLYIGDYLKDTMHLSTVEHGAYLLLIMHYWQNGGLPQEPIKLARIARMTKKEWDEIAETLAEMFSDGWRHKRIDGELSDAASKYERRAEAGRKGGMARQNVSNATDKTKPGSSNASSPAQAMLPDEDSNAEAYAGDAGGNSQPQPQPIRDASHSMRTHPPAADGWPPDCFDQWYAAFPRHVGKDDARRSFDKLRKSGKTPWPELLAATERFARHLRQNPPEDPKFIPHPATWLNKGRWADEPDTPAGLSTTPNQGNRRNDRGSALNSAFDELRDRYAGAKDPQAEGRGSHVLLGDL